MRTSLVVRAQSAAAGHRPLLSRAVRPALPVTATLKSTPSSSSSPWQGDRKHDPTQQQQQQGPVSIGSTMAACGAAVALSLAVSLMSPAHALAELPAGKKAVSGPELVEIIKEDFLKRKYLVTGNLTKEVGRVGGQPEQNRWVCLSAMQTLHVRRMLASMFGDGG